MISHKFDSIMNLKGKESFIYNLQGFFFCRGGWEVVKFYTGGSSPRSETYPFYTVFERKGSPFMYIIPSSLKPLSQT